MTDFKLDWGRRSRTGAGEAVLCKPKTIAQIDAIVAHAGERSERLLLTRLGRSKHARLAHATRSALDYEPESRTAILGPVPVAAVPARIAIVAAGTSDAKVAREALRTLAFEGEAAALIVDVGVAGLWRLAERIDEIRRHRALIAVAGMEGALFSVLSGLVGAPVIAVPTSVGYGVAKNGRAALAAALASCAAGLVVVNVDNGFGAAQAALRMVRDLPSP